MPFDVPERIATAQPDSSRLARTRRTIVSSASPIRPLPSNAKIMLLCVGALILLAVLLTIPFGFFGFRQLTAGGMAVDYGELVLLAFVLAGCAVEQMIPGARRIVPPVAGVFLAIVLLTATSSLLFPVSGMHDFVGRGIPCLRLGLLCAVPGAGFIAVMMRRGLVLDTLPASIAGSGLAGLLGVFVLALHCPVFNAAHIIVWHVTVIAATSLAGAVVGWSLARRG